MELKTTLLAGKPFEQTLKYVKEVNPTMVVMGRIGYHSDDEMDIGGNTENMMRYLPTNVLVTNFEYQAPDLYTAEQHMTWTKEALERLDRIPGFVVGMATGAIIRYAIEKGYTVITTGVIDEVIKNILPPGAMESMRAIGDQMRAAEAMGEDQPIDLFKDFDERTQGSNGSTNGHTNGDDAAAKQEIFETGRGGFGRPRTRGTWKASRRRCRRRSAVPPRASTSSATSAATSPGASRPDARSAAQAPPTSTRWTARSRRPTRARVN